MSGPRSLKSLRDMTRRTGPQAAECGEMESALDSLLDEAENPAKVNARAAKVEEKPPIERLRDLFVERLLPHVERVNDRYAAKGIHVVVDAQDFVAGGINVKVEIHFKESRLVLDGTVTADCIAFHETRHTNDTGGTVLSGPMLRTRNLDEQVFGDFLYERIILLVKAVSKK